MSKENRVSDELAKKLDALAAHFEAACHVGDAYMVEGNAADAKTLRDAAEALRPKPVAGVEVKPLEWHLEFAAHEERLAAECFKSGFAVEAEKHGLKAQFHRHSAEFFSTLSLPAQEPAFYGVWSGKIHIGTWPDEKTAREVASEYDSPTVVPLYASPQPEAVITEEMAERAARVIDPTLWMLFADQQQRTGEPMADIAARSGRWAAAKETARSTLAAALKEA